MSKVRAIRDTHGREYCCTVAPDHLGGTSCPVSPSRARVSPSLHLAWGVILASFRQKRLSKFLRVKFHSESGMTIEFLEFLRVIFSCTE